MAIIIIIINVIKSNNPLIDYKVSAANYYSQSTNIQDKNDYAVIKAIVNDFQNKMKNYPDLNTNKDGFKEFYEFCVYPPYKNKTSLKKFFDLSRTFFTNTISEDGVIEYIEDIGMVRENFYIAKYTKNDGEKEVDSYIGIVIEPSSGRYYIWYIG